MNTKIEGFEDVVVRDYVCRKRDVMAAQFGKSSLVVRPIIRISGGGREDLIAYYPVDFSLTHGQNRVVCQCLLEKLAGGKSEIVEGVLLTPEETTLANPPESDKPAPLCEKP